jgi:glycosyltransferase involved in cell wall biosynthesis
VMSLFKHSAIQASTTIKDYNTQYDTHCRLEGGLRVRGEFHKKTENSKPLVSIITVVRNGEKTLEQTVQSVLNQTYANIEYIIIDGGSKDGTLDIVRKYEDKIAYWMSETDNGISDAFNKGIASSTGELVGIINADDWYSVNAVETIVNYYLKNSDCIYHAKLQYWDSAMNPYYIFSGDDEKILRRGTINHPTVFVPRKIYEEIGSFNISFKNAVDYEWLLRAKLRGKRFYFIDQVISDMRLEGKSDKKWLNNYIEIFKARDLHGMSRARNFLLFLEMTIITIVRNFFEHIGLHGVVRIYRKYFSIVKKETGKE